MISILAENIAKLLIVAPFFFLSLKKRNSAAIRILVVFAVFFSARICLLRLPFEYSQTDVMGGSWNWAGKIYAILGSAVFLLLYREYGLKDYYLTLKQNPVFFKKGLLVVGVMLLAGSTVSFVFGTPLEFDLETVLFQLTMPGIDEEIAYRGIMLGLLAKVLKEEIKVHGVSLGNPSILITAILFGLAHGFFINDKFEISVKIIPFFMTMISGWIWGWITIKSGSILLALVSHNLGNVSGKVIRMR